MEIECLEHLPSNASIYMYFFSSSGVEGFTSQEDQEMISRVEKQLKRRFAIGSQVSEHSIVQDFTKQVGGKRAALQFFGFFLLFYGCLLLLDDSPWLKKMIFLHRTLEKH